MARGFKIGGGTSIISGGDATANDILSGKTAYVDGREIIGAIVTVAGKTITPATSSQTESSSGKHYSSDITVAAIPNQQDGGAWTPSTSAQTMVSANKYLKTAVTVNAIPNQQNGGTWTPSTSAQTMVSANKYLKTAVTVNAIPNQTTGGAKYATTSAQTILAANKWLTSALTIGALSQANLATANILRGKTITISNGSSNVWSVGGSNSVLKMISGNAVGTTSSNVKKFDLDSSSSINSMRYIAVNPGMTPVYAVSISRKNGKLIWMFRSGATQGNYKIADSFTRENYFSGLNTAWRWTSSAVDLPASASEDSSTVYYWIFGY